MSQSKLWDTSYQKAFTPIGKGNLSGNTPNLQRYPVTFASNRFNQQRTLIIGNDLTAFDEISSIIIQAYPQAEIITARDYTTALNLIEQIQPQSAIADLEFLELTPDSTRIDASLKLVKQLLTSHWHPNILVLGDNLSSLNYLQPAIKNYQGGFAAVKRSLSKSDLACYIDLVQWGAVYPPGILKPYPGFQVRWLKLLYLRYQEGFNDREIARKLNISDRTIRNYWSRIQDALSIPDNPDKDTKILIGIEARKLGLID